MAQKDECNPEESLYIAKLLCSIGYSKPLQLCRQEKTVLDISIPETFASDVAYGIISGSEGDGLKMFYGYGTTDLSSDTDYIRVTKYPPVYEEGRKLDAKNSECFMLKTSDPKYAGYARLKVFNPGPEVSKLCISFRGELYISSRILLDRVSKFAQDHKAQGAVHGPAMNVNSSPREAAEFIERSGYPTRVRTDTPAFRQDSPTGVDLYDFVFAYHGHGWPSEAVGWINRHRCHQWPTREMVDKITRYGYILAPVGQKEATEEERALQFRISFNMAEKLLVKTLNETQIQVYALLKMTKNILKDVSGKTITSYIMKNVIFWSVELTDWKEWCAANLIPLFMQCICRLRLWVSGRFMPNYFIGERNMFLLSELTPETTNKIVTLLSDIEQNAVRTVRDLQLITPHLGKSLVELERETLCKDILEWLDLRLSPAEEIYLIASKSLPCLYDNEDIERSIENCKIAIQKLRGYSRQLLGLIQNSLGVLHLANAFKQQKKEAQINERMFVCAYLQDKEIMFTDKTHCPLRVATCMLKEMDYGECLKLLMQLDTKTADYLLFNQNYITFIRQSFLSIKSEIEEMQKESSLCLDKIRTVILQDIQRSSLPEVIQALDNIQGAKKISHLLKAAWMHQAYDVMFMNVERAILPIPVQRELDNISVQRQIISPTQYGNRLPATKIFVTFHPMVYLKFMGFLCCYEMGNRGKNGHLMWLSALKEAVENVCGRYKTRGLNLLAYCYTLADKYQEAAQCVIRSLKHEPHLGNVALLYIKIVYEQLSDIFSSTK